MTASFFFNSKNHQPKKQLLLSFLFKGSTVVALGIDSVFFTQHYFDARVVINSLAIIYFGLFFFYSDLELRKLMFCMIFLSYLGEVVFCTILKMYAYRTPHIPLYVPFGHAIVYASGYVFSQTAWIIKYDKKLQFLFGCFFVLLFLSVGLWLNDVFSLLFGVLFFVLLKRKKWQNLYYCIAFCVIFIELVGTFYKCWTWAPIVFGSIAVANPPMGAVFFYAGGDAILGKIVERWKN